MSREFRLFVLQEHSPQSHTYVGSLQHTVNVPSTKTVGLLAETVRRYIKSCPELKSWGEDVDEIDFVVRQVRRQQIPIEPLNRGSIWPPQNPQKLEKRGLVEMADRGQLNEESILAPNTVLETLGDSLELIFVFGALFHSPLKRSAHLARRKLVVSFRIIPGNSFVPRVSRGRKDNCTPRAECGCYQGSRSELCEGLPRLDSGG
ncbi:hypothetical protein BDM02DRAFT_2331371 [Thelephora ganbajun]|uniref:Uncharacterized protein n=1 Tax=Thelephora ganbajun TaxID=370292 RepID=A0ACB6ZEI0_THEGA|nr:hypothetical protein BDM02DRAFT_2331371 [Thelephora ganbajun]